MSYSIRTGVFPTSKRPEREAHRSLPSGIEVKMSAAIPPLPSEAFLRFTGTTFPLRYLDWATVVSF